MRRLIIVVALATSAVACARTEMAAEETLPVRVYVMVGQSNMQGHGHIDDDKPNSLRHIVRNDPEGKFQFLVGENGEWRERSDVWILRDSSPREAACGGLKPGYGAHNGVLGPELGFGHKVGDAYEGQVLIIKTAWGGKSLGNDFLSPSIGRYPDPIKPGDPGFYYREILRIVGDVTENIGTYFPGYRGEGIEIAGLCYHQGWNDQYGGFDATYEENLAGFINDIRSVEHGLGVPGLPVVIASSGMIRGGSPVTRAQLAMGDRTRYPQFDGNVAVVDTGRPYGPDELQFLFPADQSPRDQGYHWNGNARTHLHIGFAMAAEMSGLEQPALPSRLKAHGVEEGVQLTWQYGADRPRSVELIRNGENLGVELPPAGTGYVDTTALPGRNDYELVLKMRGAPTQTLRTTCDTSVQGIEASRSNSGVMLTWKARGRFEGFEISRDGTTLEQNYPGGERSYEDIRAPEDGLVTYSIRPTTGRAAPAMVTVNLGPIDPGEALVYEPFDYPADPEKPQSILDVKGPVGTKGAYFNLKGGKPDRAPAAVAGGLSYGELPVTGNRCASHRWGSGCAIELDDSLGRAGLLEDGATLWMSYVFRCSSQYSHYQGGGTVALCTRDLKEGVGLMADNREFRTVVVVDGKQEAVRIASSPHETPTLVVGRIVWGSNGGNDSFVPFTPGYDLKQPEKHGRAARPFDIDQSRLSLLVIRGEGQFDEIRVGPTYESVVGGGTRSVKR